MYSHLYAKLHKNLLLVTCVFGYSPITYDEGSAKYKIRTYGQAGSVCHFLFLFAYNVIIFPTHIISLYKEKDSQMLIFTIIVWLSSLIGTVCLANNLWNCDEICQLWNGFPQYFRMLEEKFITRGSSSNPIFTFLLFLSVALCIGSGCLITLHAFVFPTAGPYLLYSVPKRLVVFPLRFGYSCCFFGVQANGVTMLLAVYMAQGLSAYYSLKPLLKELRLGQVDYQTEDDLRSIENLTHAYRCLEVLVKQFNIAFCNIFLPFELIFGNLSLFCNVTMALFWKKLDFDTSPFLVLSAAFSVVGFSTCLAMCGILNAQSRKTVSSWKVERWNKRSEKMYMERFKRSCKEINIRSFGMMTIRPISALKYMNSTGKATFRAILMLRKALIRSR